MSGAGSGAGAGAGAGGGATGGGGPPPPPPPVIYIPAFHTAGQYPAPDNNISKTIESKATKEEQRQAATDLRDFLNDPTSNLRDLNGEPRIFTAIIMVPGKPEVKVVYGFELGTVARIGAISPIKDKVLAMYGDGGPTIGFPQVMVLEPTIRDPVQVKTPTEAFVQSELQKANQQVDQPVVKALNCTEEENVLILCPVPAYWVYDGFTKDLPAALVYERVLDCQHDSPMRSDALKFLRACLVSSHRQQDVKPYIPQDIYQRMAPQEARAWAVNKFNLLCPPLPPPPPIGGGALPGQPGGVAALATAAGATGTTGAQVTLDANTVALLVQGMSGQHRSATAEEKKDDGGSDPKIGEIELRNMKRMCGLPADAQFESLPAWFQKLFEKNLTDEEKTIIVSNELEKRTFYDEAEIPIYPELLRTIIKRTWTAQDLGKRSAYANAAKGVTPFAMIDLSDNDVAEMYMTAADVSQATYVTSGEVTKLREKLKATVPASTDKLILKLKRYTNYLYALYTSRCPKYLRMRKIMTALLNLRESARARMSHDVRASILWIIHLQARKFAKGQMIAGDKEECLFEFTNLLNVLQTKNCHSISHDELPDALRGNIGIGTDKKSTTAKRTAGTFLNTQGVDDEEPVAEKEPKKPKNRIVQEYNKDLAEHFAEAMKITSKPGLQKVCDYCGITKRSLVPDLDVRKDCRQFLVLGWCGFDDRGKCILNHRTATPDQVKIIKEKTFKFTNDPNGMLSGKKD